MGERHQQPLFAVLLVDKRPLGQAIVAALVVLDAVD